jgi:DNA polymerase-3 subunit delta
MAALKAGEVEAFVARPDPSKPVILVYGPDAGLVAERARLLATRFVDDAADSFALVRLDGDTVAADPARLADEIWTVPLFGGRRAVWLRVGSKQVQAAVAPLLDGQPPPAPLVIEAGDLKKSAPLRALIEKSPRAVALPCYSDGPGDVGRLIDQDLRAAGLSIDQDARSLLQQSLGADRQLSRRELEKLVLYMGSQRTVTAADVAASVVDAAATGADDVVDAAFAGDMATLERDYARLLADGTPAQMIVLAASRHAVSLHRARLAMDAGKPAKAAVEGLIPPLHFSRVNAAIRALSIWTQAGLVRAIEQTQAAVLETRRTAVLADAIAGRCLMALAQVARRDGRRAG